MKIFAYEALRTAYFELTARLRKDPVSQTELRQFLGHWHFLDQDRRGNLVDSQQSAAASGWRIYLGHEIRSAAYQFFSQRMEAVFSGERISLPLIEPSDEFRDQTDRLRLASEDHK